MFSKDEIQNIIENFNVLPFYQFVSKLQIKDDSIKSQVANLLKEKHSNSRQKLKRDNKLRYLIRKYFLDNVDPKNLIDSFFLINKEKAKILFGSIYSDTIEMMQMMRKYKELSDKIREEKIKYEERGPNDPPGPLEQKMKLNRNITDGWKNLDDISQRAIFNVIISEWNFKDLFNMLRKIWKDTKPSVQNEFFDEILNLIISQNLDGLEMNNYIHILEDADSAIKQKPGFKEIVKRFLTRLKQYDEQEIKKCYLLEDELEETVYFFMEELVRIYSLLPKEIKNELKDEILKICDGFISKNDLDYTSQIFSILEFAGINQLDVIELFQDRIDKNQEYTISIKIDSLSKETIEKITSLMKKGFKLFCSIEIKSAADLPIQRIEEVSQAIDIKTIDIIDSAANHLIPMKYSVSQYKNCREKIDRIIDGACNDIAKDDPNREKKIFGKIIRRLAHLVTYDDELCEKIDNKTINSEESFQCSSMLGALAVVNIDGEGRAVCSGISETSRNVFRCLGFDIICVSGDRELQKENGETYNTVHMWNQIKLDGKWYWFDLTWDIQPILGLNIPKNMLKSDKDFENHLQVYNKGKFKSQKRYQSSESVGNYDLAFYIYGGDSRRENELISAIKTVHPAQLKNAQRVMLGEASERTEELSEI